MTERLPDAVEVAGQVYPINTDFRACLDSVMAAGDPELTAYEKSVVILQNLYGDKLPPDVEQALAQAVKFLNGGDEINTDDDAPEPADYSFVQDAPLIFSAFHQVHFISLDDADMHWWKFRALLIGLFGSETPFGRLVSLRQRVRTGKATDEEKRAARNMGDLFTLPEPDMRTTLEREREAEFLQAIQEGQKRAKQTTSNG